MTSSLLWTLLSWPQLVHRIVACSLLHLEYLVRTWYMAGDWQVAVLAPVHLVHVHLPDTFNGCFCVSDTGTLPDMCALFHVIPSMVPRIESHTRMHFLRKYFFFFLKNFVLSQSLSSLAKKYSTQDLEAVGKIKQVFQAQGQIRSQKILEMIS